MQIYLSPLAEQKLLALTSYLLEHWNKKIRDKFIDKLTAKIKQISSQPQSCPKSKAQKGLFKCVVSKQTTFYYQLSIDKKEIEIVTFFDTRQNPKKLSKDLK